MSVLTDPQVSAAEIRRIGKHAHIVAISLPSSTIDVNRYTGRSTKPCSWARSVT